MKSTCLSKMLCTCLYFCKSALNCIPYLKCSQRANDAKCSAFCAFLQHELCKAKRAIAVQLWKEYMSIFCFWSVIAPRISLDLLPSHFPIPISGWGNEIKSLSQFSLESSSMLDFTKVTSGDMEILTVHG